MSDRLFDGILSVLCPLALTLVWILPTHAANALGVDDYCAPPGIEIRQVVPQLEPASSNYRYDRNHITDNEAISVVLAGNDIVVINVADGAVKMRVTLPGGPFYSFSTIYLRTEGGILYLTYKESLGRIDEQQITLRALDLATGGWLWERSVKVTAKWKGVIGEGEGASIAFYAGEIRAIFADGQMARWQLSDLTNLPTYYFEQNSFFADNKDAIGPGPSSAIGASMGDSFCAGISDNRDGLVIVNAGKSVIQKLSLEYLTLGPAVSSSSYLVARASTNSPPARGEYFFSVWNLRKPKDPPVSTIRIPFDYGLPSADLKIWKDRYLLAATTSRSTLRSETLLSVYDLASPGQAPLKIQLPVGLPGIVDMGITGKDFWFLTDLKPVAMGWVRGVADTINLAAVYVDDARGSEATGFLNFNVHVDGNFTSPVTVHLKSRSGSAREGFDYVGYDQTLTFTPESPSTVVTIPILPDTELEAYEAMILEVVEVNHAWRGNQFAIGTIFGGGISKIETMSPPPGAGDYTSFGNWAMTPEGVVAGVYDGKGGYRYYLKRLGGANWEEISCLSSGRSLYGSQIVAVRGNRVCATVSDGNP
ncbi:MAG: Calx-beta domain-containing protein, partial [Luteolibacter sp.]